MNEDLQNLFDEIPPLPADEQFVDTALRNIHRARRQQLIYKLLTVTFITTTGAIAAPYVAEATLASSQYALTDAGALLACACATLLTWRIARRALS